MTRQFDGGGVDYAAVRASLGGNFNERSISLRHRRGLAFGVLAMVSVASGCGDDEPPPDQTVFWLGLSQSTGAQCSSARAFGVPDAASALAAIQSGEGERLEDGGDGLVDCRVEQAGGQYNVRLEVSSGEIGNLTLVGTAAPGAQGALLNMDFTTAGFFLTQDGCTGDVQFVNPGAIWVRNLSCPALLDPSSPGISCTGNGGFIIENCDD